MATNWLAVASEWQRDWARQDSAKALGDAVLPHAGATGTAFAWELQLLGQNTGVVAGRRRGGPTRRSHE